MTRSSTGASARRATRSRRKVAGQLEPLYVSGASRIAMEQGAYGTADGAARLLELLEHQVVVVSLVRGLLDHGLIVRIGEENEREELRDCSLVLAPYVVEGEVAGSIGVLGPTRMDYRRALAVGRDRVAAARPDPAHLMASDDYYLLLGVERSATDDEIKRAYRSLARQYHPDANPGDPAAEARFKEISVAYETLRDPERRRRYDMFGPERGRRRRRPRAPTASGSTTSSTRSSAATSFGGRGGGGPAGPMTGADAEAVLDLTLAEAVFGTTKPLDVRLPVACDPCDGSGAAPGTHATRCDTCGGAGQVRQVRRSILGQIVTAGVCPTCGGAGSVIPTPCPNCGGDGRVVAERRLDVEVPAGIDDGQRLRLPGRGAAAPRGGASGDLYVHVRVAANPDFVRDGNDLLHVRSIGADAGRARAPRARSRRSTAPRTS